MSHFGGLEVKDLGGVELAGFHQVRMKGKKKRVSQGWEPESTGHIWGTSIVWGLHVGDGATEGHVK